MLAGESNAGKTESARLVVHFLSQVADARRAALSGSPLAAPPPTSTSTSTSATKTTAQSGRRTASTATSTQSQQQQQHSHHQHHHHHHPQQPQLQSRTHRQPHRQQPHHPLCRPRSVGSVPATAALLTASSGHRQHRSAAAAGGGLLKKQRSMDIDRAATAAGRPHRSTHEKSVDFDFSHHRSNDNLHSSTAAGRAMPHCVRHCNHIGSGGGGSDMSPIMSPLSAAPPMCPACRTPSPQSAAAAQITTTSCPHHHHYVGSPAYDPLFVAASPPPPPSLLLPRHSPQSAALPHSQHHSTHQCSCPGSPKEAMRSASSARQRLSSSSSLLLATASVASATAQTPAKKILKNPLARSASVRDARSSRSSSVVSAASEAPPAGADAATASTAAATAGGGGSGCGRLARDADVAQMRDRIAQAEVFLEAIGNASTQRNFNGSRYGKFFDIEIDFKGDPVGGHITHCKCSSTLVRRVLPCHSYSKRKVLDRSNLS